MSVLGATEAWRGDERLLLGSRKRRALVAALALSGGRPVSVDALVDLLWGDAPPDGVSGTLQVYVSGLRRVSSPTGRRGRRPRCWSPSSRAMRCGCPTAASTRRASTAR